MKSTSGNVLIYVLVAVVLFAFLSFSLTKQLGTGGMTSRLDTSRARLKAEELINHATALRSTIEQMRTMSNVLPDEFSFLKQGDAGYGTAPHKPKVFHPAGGGMNIFLANDELFTPASAKRGWVAQTGTNVQWTKTSGNDVIYTFLDVATPICKAINERLYKDETIPVTTLAPGPVFIKGGGDDAAFQTSACAGCVQRLSYCVQAADGSNAFYNVVFAQ